MAGLTAFLYSLVPDDPGGGLITRPTGLPVTAVPLLSQQLFG